MNFTKTLPIPSLSDFFKKASGVQKYSASATVHYRVVKSLKDSLYIQRLTAKNSKKSQRLDLGKLYKALEQLTDFNTESFRNFIPRMHSPGRALIIHLGLIVQTDSQKVVFFNTGWMTAYKGLTCDKLQGGGKHVEEHGWGSEIFNFLPYRGKLYGYVQPKIDKKYNNKPTIKIEKLGASPDDDYVDGVTVIWTATDKVNGGTRIVGWYKNARVYRHHRIPTDLSNRRYKDALQGYFAEAKAEDCRLLPIDARKVRVFRQQTGWLGQSNVWYAEKTPAFVQQVRDYISGGGRPEITNSRTKKVKGIPRQHDLIKRLEVEKSAIHCVWQYYISQGFEVKSVERDNEGWDLIASDEETSLKLEVKGLSGSGLSQN